MRASLALLSITALATVSRLAATGKSVPDLQSLVDSEPVSVHMLLPVVAGGSAEHRLAGVYRHSMPNWYA